MHSPDAIAFEAAAALDGYEARLGLLSRADVNPSDFGRADADIRKVCCWCVHLPQPSVCCVALLLSHYHLMSELSQELTGRLAPARLARIQSHNAYIAQLRHQCRSLFLAPHLH
jgi:hypothetical protein